MAVYGEIGGSLPFSSIDAAGAFSPTGDISQAYGSAYNSALEMNKANYSNILKGYQQLLSNQQAAQAPIQAGYQQLSQTTLGDIAGIEASQAQAIQDEYARQSGQAAQGLISRGLGNTTVANSVQRGLTLDQQKAQIALANQMAQLRAGYRSQLGLAGLGYANQAVGQNTGLGKSQLDWMNSVNSPYPNASLYAELARQRGFRSVNPNIQGGGGGSPASSGLGLLRANSGSYGSGGGGSNYPSTGLGRDRNGRLLYPEEPQGQEGWGPWADMFDQGTDYNPLNWAQGEGGIFSRYGPPNQSGGGAGTQDASQGWGPWGNMFDQGAGGSQGYQNPGLNPWNGLPNSPTQGSYQNPGLNPWNGLPNAQPGGGVGQPEQPQVDQNFMEQFQDMGGGGDYAGGSWDQSYVPGADYSSEGA